MEIFSDIEMLQKILNESTIILWSASSDGSFNFVSPKIENLCGFKPDEILSVQNFHWIHPDSRKLVETAWTDVVDKNGSLSLNYKMLVKDTEEYIWVKSTAIPKFDDDGNIMGWSGITENIHDTIKLQNSYEDAVKELQKKQKFEILGELTAVVAHELKNPLGTIRNSLFLMQNRFNEEYVVDDFIDHTTARIFRSIDRCNNIVSDLLDYTRHTKLIKRRTNIKDLIDRVIEDLVKPPSVQINNQVSSSLNIHADPDRLHRVFLNVMKNAIESIMDVEVGKGAGYINITSESDADCHTVSFYDNGPGIDTSKCHQLFEPLVSTKSFGIGLGLSIVQDIMKKHNGCASITGEKDKFAQVDLRFYKKPIQ